MEEPTWQELLLPAPLEAAIYGLLSIFILAGINSELIINKIARQPIFKDIAADDYRGIFSRVADFPAINTVVIVVFWGGVGLAAYTIVWAMINAVIEARNEIVVETEYANKGSLWKRLRAPILKGVLFILLAGHLVLNKWRLIPAILRMFNHALSNHGVGQLAVLVPVLLLTLDILLAATLFKTAFRSLDLIEALDKPKVVDR